MANFAFLCDVPPRANQDIGAPRKTGKHVYYLGFRSGPLQACPFLAFVALASRLSRAKPRGRPLCCFVFAVVGAALRTARRLCLSAHHPACPPKPSRRREHAEGQASLAVFFRVASRLSNAVAEVDERISWSKTNLFQRAPLLEETDHRGGRQQALHASILTQGYA